MIAQLKASKRGITKPPKSLTIFDYVNYYPLHITVRRLTRLQPMVLETFMLIASYTAMGIPVTCAKLTTIIYGSNYTTNHLTGIRFRLETLVKHGYIMNVSHNRTNRFVLTSYAIEVLNSVE